MKRLLAFENPPTYLDRYVSIRDSKHLATRNSLMAIHNEVLAAYVTHRVFAALSQLEKILPRTLAEPGRIALRACFDSPTRALKQLKADIRTAQPIRQLKYCPMCGTTLPATFDHYLPAVRFPEFSVHGLNLVPCCSQCNSIKEDDWLDASGARQYLHAFTDDVPETKFLFATLHERPAMSGVGVTFELATPAGVSAAHWSLIQSHFTRLRLIERYNQLGNDEIVELLGSCRSHLEAGGADAKLFLAKESLDRGRAHGRNHWRSVLMETLAAHPKLDDWIAAMPA